MTLRAAGPGAAEVFAREPGGHRCQRVPPNEKRGKVHTSTVTVAVLPEVAPHEFVIDPVDLEWSAMRGSGAGGQHRNVTDSAVRVVHLPTGTAVRCEAERSQAQNRDRALALLRARLAAEVADRATADRAANRRPQVGSGMRGDKVRTYRWQDDVVTDDRSGRRASLRRVLRGELELLA